MSGFIKSTIHKNGFRPLAFLWILVGIIATSFIGGCTALSSTSVNNSSVKTSSLVGSTDGDLTVVNYLPPPADLDTNGVQRISENDVLDVNVFQVDELDRTVRVSPNGTISMPLIGLIQAKGLTIQQLETVLKKKYNSKYLQNAEISVFMKESFGQRITMDGEFIKPGIYSITSQTTLLQALALAGGLTALSDEKKLYVYREYPSGKKVTNFSVLDIRSGKMNDPNLYGGDVIVAFTSKSKIAAQNLRQALGIATSATRVVSPL